MILIAGDSWGCGCWDTNQKVYHRGLEQYLHDNGHNVINLSGGGSCLEETTQVLGNFLRQIQLSPWLWMPEPITKVFVFQTEWNRGSNFDWLLSSAQRELHKFKNQGDDQKIIASFYGALSYIAIEYNVDIQIIGGCSDIIWIDDFQKCYPGVSIACQSFTNLLVNDNHRIDNPVFSVRFPPQLIEDEHTMQLAQLGQEREKIWQANPDWMYPDGGHPNHLGHKKLYEHIKGVLT